MRISLPKLKAITLYFCQNTDPEYLGKVKLMKLFYFLDFLHVKRHGYPITYDDYVNLEHGPVPKTIKNIVDELADHPEDSAIGKTVSIAPRKLGENIQLQVTRRRDIEESELGMFSGDELEILKEVCLRFYNATGKEIEDVSHAEAPWSKTKYLEEIPYELAGYDFDSKFTPEEINQVISLMR